MELLKTSLVAQTVKRLPTMQRPWFNPWVGKISWRRKWQSTPVFLPGKFREWRNLVGYSPWGCKELDMTERIHFGAILPMDSYTILSYCAVFSVMGCLGR